MNSTYLLFCATHIFFFYLLFYFLKCNKKNAEHLLMLLYGEKIEHVGRVF